MMNRFGLDRFKKATAAEPFSVTQKAAASIQQRQQQQQQAVPPAAPALLPAQSQFPTAVPSADAPAVATTALGAGQSTWRPPDWAAEPKSAAYWLDVMKEGDVVDKITLDRKRLIFGRQQLMCDLVLDHPSVSRQHAAVLHHRNGGIYVIDLGSVHGTFVANERLSKDNPVELEIGQSLRFAASTRVYVLRRSTPASIVPLPAPTDVVLPPPPDASDEEAVVAYNTSLNRLGIPGLSAPPFGGSNAPPGGPQEREGNEGEGADRPSKRARRGGRVSFRDDYGGLLAEVVGVSDGADVSTEPGPVGVREGSLVGRYESLVQVTVIPKGQEDAALKPDAGAAPAVTQRLKQYLDKVKAPGKAVGNSLYGDIYGESLAGMAGGSWATVQDGAESVSGKQGDGQGAGAEAKVSNGALAGNANAVKSKADPNFDSDDLFGEDEDE